MRNVAVTALGACLLAGLVVGLAIVGGVGGATTATSSATAGAVATAFLRAEQDSQCSVVAGPVAGLSPAQSQDAETIVSVSDTLTHESSRAARIALMTAVTESGLVNVDGGVGGAYGLFQQTPGEGWGSVAQVMDPTYATTQFVTRLLRLPSWTGIPPWVAAQDVQRSGAGQPTSPLNPAPGVVGGNYRAHWARAGAILALLRSRATATGCGSGPSGGEAGPAARYGLPVGYRVPAGVPPQAAAAISYAISKLGDRYVYGAAGPSQFDCSGLTMMAWAAGGVRLDHYTVDQMNEGARVAAAQITPGDLVLIPGDDPPGPGLPGHVGIYLGHSLVLSAVDPAYGVIVQSWATFTGGGLDAIVNPLNSGA